MKKEITTQPTPSEVNEGKHTPGPWIEKKLDENHSVIYGSTGMVIIPRMISEPGKTSAADAKLIASAPQLKADNEALKEQLSQIAGESNASIFKLMGDQKQTEALKEANRELLEALKKYDDVSEYLIDRVNQKTKGQTLELKNIVSDVKATISKHSVNK